MRSKSVLLALLIIITFSNSAFAQRYAANVLYSDHPLPIYIGIDVGAGLTTWQHATPTYFATQYPYSSDTIHAWFPNGAKPLFGFFAGISADFWLSENWGIIAKLNYNERRGNWNATAITQGDSLGFLENVPVTNDLTWMLRCVSLEAYARYKFTSLSDFYVGAGLALTDIVSDHYDLTQTLGGPPEFTFEHAGTAVRSYSVGGSLSSELASMFGEVKLLAGFPFYIGNRWVLAPEVTLGIPITSVWNSSAKADYLANGITDPPTPLTISGMITLRYQIR
ncbi:MAG TPA: hypothetical protein VG537_05190 [Candidatus Kapabacteria bacterium]|jgi:hypothetical protein|nr:hypothetical protein [Candidatus Kapabacteria bacterium]